MMKKTSFLVLIAILILCCAPIQTYAQDDISCVNNQLLLEIVDTNGMSLEEMHNKDLLEYNSKMNSINPETKMNFDILCEKYSSNCISKLGAVELLSLYQNEFSDNNETLERDLEDLSRDILIDAVRAYYRIRGFSLSLTFFDHSLVSNPSDISITLTGATDADRTYIKSLLSNDTPFMNNVMNFANMTSGATYTNLTGCVFSSGDLFWAIHGYSCELARSSYGRAVFGIHDYYDFQAGQDIYNSVGSWLQTNPYYISIYGIVDTGVMQ